MNVNTVDEGNTAAWTGIEDKPRIISVLEDADSSKKPFETTPPKRRGFFRFISELRRRKVCRAATTYCVALWLICQILEVVSPQFGLPEWTLNFVIVLGLLGFPIALIVSWLFDVTTEGLVLDSQVTRDGRNPRGSQSGSRFEQAIDCSLLFAALAIGSQLALTSIGTNLMASPVEVEEMLVRPFPVTAESNAEAFSGALQVELQHELARLESIRVIVPRDPTSVTSGSSITGSVALMKDSVHVTVVVIDNRSGEVTWSEVLSFPVKEISGSPRSIAEGIVSALEGWSAAFAMTDQEHG